MFDEVLKNALDEIEGARCVLLAGADGMVVASAGDEEGPAPDAVAASLADLFRRVAAAHRDAGLAPPEEFTSGGRRERAALRAVSAHYLLVAVLGESGNLGRTRYALRKASAALQSELG
jgi:predicted regulator of Ras-like GTPase activity (Roadblock/LC7/MglB family)